MARIVVALGGNALGNTPEEQITIIGKAAVSLVELVRQGHEIVLCHGNGPQVGMIQLAFDTAAEQNSAVAKMGLAECTAMSQGYIGYHLQQGILRELRKHNLPYDIATVVTQVVVDAHDPAFAAPTKPIGAFYTKAEAETIAAQHPDFVMREDAGRGYRRMVASPQPVDIVEKNTIVSLLEKECIVIACGGGGIPVVAEEGGTRGVAAVIDKDFASGKLAELLNADCLFILTAVDRAAIHFGTPQQQELASITVKEALQYCEEGHFAPGSMLPKIQAAIRFAQLSPDKKAVVGSLEKAALAMQGESGTWIQQGK